MEKHKAYMDNKGKGEGGAAYEDDDEARGADEALDNLWERIRLFLSDTEK